MSISQAIQTLKSLLRAAFRNRNRPEKWGGWVTIDDAETDQERRIELDGKVKRVQVEMTGLVFEIELDDQTVVLEGRPNLRNLDVYLDNVFDPDARVVVRSRATASHPLRTAVDFRPVTLGGDECRFNLRFLG